ncbi:MAG: hypothetical protein JNJ88_11515 [Planctomycetes bacterium]|nr:hypothetical protein [Planctomycetota bacterium]
MNDVDGDACADLIVGVLRGGYARYGPGEVLAISGASMGLLWRRRGAEVEPGWGDAFGICVSSIQDVDLDGVPDLAVGAPRRRNWNGDVDLVSGKSGELIRTISATQDVVGFGRYPVNWIARSRTISDGFLLVPQADPPITSIIDPKSSAVVGVVPGSYCVIVGDINNDDQPDFIMADLLFPGEGNHVTIYAYCGASFNKIFSTILGGDLARLALESKQLNCIAIPDVDSDGVQDIALCSRADEAVLISGRSGSTLMELRPSSALYDCKSASIVGLSSSESNSAFSILRARASDREDEITLEFASLSQPQLWHSFKECSLQLVGSKLRVLNQSHIISYAEGGRVIQVVDIGGKLGIPK